jgi:hypothetical protein
MRSLILMSVCLVSCWCACSAPTPATTTGDTDESTTEDEGEQADGGRSTPGRDAAAKPPSGPNRASSPIDDDDDDDAAQCGSVRAEAELQPTPVDIIIALDTSGSMAPNVCNVSKNLTTFAAAVGENSHVVSIYEMGLLGLVTQAVCGSSDPLAMTELAKDSARYLHSAITVDSFNALTQIAGNYEAYEKFLRANAATHIIVVSDDESDPFFGGLTAADFKMQMDKKLGRPFFFHSIVADGKATDCLYSRVGTQYLTLSEQTMGQKLSICAQDWSALFAQLEEAIVSTASIPCDFEIPPPPRGEALDPNAVQVVFRPTGSAEEQFPRADTASSCGSAAAWHYDDPEEPKRIALCPAACDAVKRSGKVDIAFGCEPIFVQ